MNDYTLAQNNGDKDFDEEIEELKKQFSVEHYKAYQAFIKDKSERPNCKEHIIEAYESILQAER